MSKRKIDLFSQIDPQKPSALIIRQIRDLISRGDLTPGDRLPSERHLAERMAIGRGHVREAIQRLEFYGILRTYPQRGTFVANIGVRALEGLLANVIELEKEDFESLIDTRMVLEEHAARLSAERRTEEDLAALEKALLEFEKLVRFGQDGLEEDLVFHLKIAECARSNVLRSLVSLITPDIILMSRALHTCDQGRGEEALKEHRDVLDAIRRQDSEGAAMAMKIHMTVTKNLSHQLDNAMVDREKDT
jgi:GntR family transcriptional regulator, transcriptional repressor for pyruvate dehydrogenase complex